MKFPRTPRYTREHQWVRIEGNHVTIGISDFGQRELGDVIFVELPKIGDYVTKDESFGVMESLKAVADVRAPISGKVIEINDDLVATPELINVDPYGDGWLIRLEMSRPSEVQQLLSASQYKTYIADEGGVNEDEIEADEA